MAVTVRIPTPLRKLTGDAAEVEAAGSTVRELIEDLEARFPGLKERLCDETGAVRRFVNVYVGEEDIRFLKGLDTEVGDGQVVSIIPAVAGGQQPLACWTAEGTGSPAPSASLPRDRWGVRPARLR